MDKPEVLAIVPARAGSKGVPGKNVHLLAGHPLIAYAVVAGKACPAITRVIVSTDSPELAKIGRLYGAETPFLRPAELASDTASDLAYVRHALEWLESEEGWRPALVVQLRPTTPLRDPETDGGDRALVADEDATSLRSAHRLNESPHKMLQIWTTGSRGSSRKIPGPNISTFRGSFPPPTNPTAMWTSAAADSCSPPDNSTVQRSCRSRR